MMIGSLTPGGQFTSLLGRTSFHLPGLCGLISFRIDPSLGLSASRPVAPLSNVPTAREPDVIVSDHAFQKLSHASQWRRTSGRPGRETEDKKTRLLLAF